MTYNEIEARAKADAIEYMPAIPAQNTLEAWESFQAALDDVEPSECAHQSADSWDVVIYNYKAMKLVTCAPSDVVSDAESDVEECGGVADAFESGGIYGVATLVAYWIVYRAVCDAIESARDELMELAQAQIEGSE